MHVVKILGGFVKSYNVYALGVSMEITVSFILLFSLSATLSFQDGRAYALISLPSKLNTDPVSSHGKIET